MVCKGPVLRTDLPGVWRRVVLVDGAGSEDRESIVYWIQSMSLCGDIRLHRRASTMVGPPGDVGLPWVDAFAGCLVEGAGTFRWEPRLRWRAHAGPPDEGRLSWLGDDIEERGVHLDYSEQWTRVAEMVPGQFAVCLRDSDGTRLAYVLNVGAYVFFAVGDAAEVAGGALADPQFSLFEMTQDGARMVVSTAEPGLAFCPRVEFRDAGRRMASLLPAGATEPQRRSDWRVGAIEECRVSRPGSSA